MMIIVLAIAEKVVAGSRLRLGPEIPAKLSELIQRCWNHDRTRRPAFAQIVTGRMLEKSKMHRKRARQQLAHPFSNG